ncbi:hypothetical protein ACFQY4_44615 [Catellatospora bangladeshensis]|uniref:hypothetical protein n=1 Tax=Catellatospora bangladeshensis TaxID=310355 RepID=UPI00362139EA
MDRFDESFDQRQDGDYDVAVVGRHLAGGWLATILARHGARVLLVDGPQTPGTRPGETTVPYTTAVLELLAERFDVPEIGAFAHFVDLPPRYGRPVASSAPCPSCTTRRAGCTTRSTPCSSTCPASTTSATSTVPWWTSTRATSRPAAAPTSSPPRPSRPRSPRWTGCG